MNSKKTESVRLGYVIVYVPDVRAALQFYERAFGLTQRFLHETGQYGELETGATALAFADERTAPLPDVFQPNRADERAAGAEVALVVADVQAAFNRALAADAIAVAKPTTKPWGQTVAYIRDLNGFLVEICSEIPG